MPFYESCIFILQTIGNLLAHFMYAILQYAWHRMLGPAMCQTMYGVGHS